LGVNSITSILQNFVLVFIIYFASIIQANAVITHDYTVQVKNDLTGINVKICFRSALPSKLVSYNSSAIQHIKSIALLSNGKILKNLRIDRRTITLPSIKEGDCVSYESDFNGQTSYTMSKKKASKKQQVLIDIRRWLWFPDNFNTNTHALDITFQLPDGMNVSSPWKLLHKRKNITKYRYAQRPPQWEGLIAIGKFKTETVQKGSAMIKIAILNAKQPVNTNSIMQWVDNNINALLKTYGEFPVAELQLLIVPIGNDREPVPWGEAMRGGGDAVHVYIDETRPIKEFLNDWVLIHELSHLLHPRFDDASWLAEGLASYYQNVLGARGGRFTRQIAWQKLHEGFERGIEGTPANKSLSQVSSSMMKTRSFMRVYWSGAAISLLADYELRKQSNNKQSLDTALKELNRYSSLTSQLNNSYEIMMKLDSITQTNIFTNLYRQHLPSETFPDLTSVYSGLGLTVVNNRINFDNNAPYASIRKAIMFGE